MDLTELEHAILLQFVQKFPDLVFEGFVSTCQVTERDRTSCGFFTTFFRETQPPVTEENKENEFVLLNELRMTASNLTEGADVLLILKYGQVDYLEVKSIGDGNPLDAKAYGFEDMSVNYIDF
jgi:hypothetical protein